MPHRPLAAAVALGVLTCLSAGTASAQPSFTLVDRQPVGRGPLFTTTGRFEPGLPNGVAVSSFWVDEVSIFALPDRGLLGEPFILDAGRNLRDLVSFDIDGDGSDDLVVADQAGGARDARLLAILRGAGGFHDPEEIILETGIVETIASGNFDGLGAPDIATANGREGTVSLVYGTANGLVAGANLFLAGMTTDVAVIDLNRDGLDDLAVLSQRDDTLSVVTTLRSEGAVFLPFGDAIELDIVGVRIMPGYYDSNGLLDLAVIADGPGITQYSSRTLIAQPPDPITSEPRFVVEPRTFDCPVNERGEATRCELFDAVSADFDRNGFNDVAVSMPQPGVVAVLPRSEAGFDPPVIVDPEGSPRGIGAGDVTGDGFDDLVVTEFDEDVITVMRSVPPAACLGDCNLDEVVTVDEILSLMQIALGADRLEICPAADGSGDGRVTVDEIVGAIDVALAGC
jgi:hypothetical protein